MLGLLPVAAIIELNQRLKSTPEWLRQVWTARGNIDTPAVGRPSC